MMQLPLLLLLLPLCSCLQSSHVQVTIGDSSYSHGDKQDLPHPVPAPPQPHAPPPAPTARPYVPSPAPTAYPASVVKQLPAVVHQPVHHPVHHPVHQPVQHALHHAAPHAVHLPHHAPVYAEQHHSRYMGAGDCELMDEMVYAELCVPTLRPMCTQEKLMIKRVMEKEQCQDITRTVCTEDMVTVPNTVCTYMYKTEEMMATAQTVDISYEKSCRDEMVSVCDPHTSGYGTPAYGQQYCKEVSQQVCYNKPMAMPMKEEVKISYPVPMMECKEMPLMLPSVMCEDVMEKRCFMVPEAMDDEMMVEKCSVEISAPSCSQVQLNLPKHVCKSMPYGDLQYTA